MLALGAQRFDAMPVLPRVLESGGARFLGAVSYPLYLLNEPVQRAAAMVLAPLAHGNAVVFTWLWLPVALVRAGGGGGGDAFLGGAAVYAGDEDRKEESSYFFEKK